MFFVLLIILPPLVFTVSDLFGNYYYIVCIQSHYFSLTHLLQNMIEFLSNHFYKESS